MTPEEKRALEKQVAELMGLRLFTHRREGFCVPQVDGNDDWDNAFSGPWNPCGRPDHWAKVVEWVRGRDEKFQTAFIHCLLEIWKRDSEITKAPIVWFLLEGNAGIATCKAFVAAVGDG